MFFRGGLVDLRENGISINYVRPHTSRVAPLSRSTRNLWTWRNERTRPTSTACKVKSGSSLITKRRKARHKEHRPASPPAPRRGRNRRRIIPGLRFILDSCCLSRAFVSAVEPTTWSIYASLPRNPCSRFPRPRTGDLRRAQTTRKTAHALSRPGTSARQQLRPIHTGIRESRFDATVGVQLLGHLNFVPGEQSPSL
jgi:hypothetical protein